MTVYHSLAGSPCRLNFYFLFNRVRVGRGSVCYLFYDTIEIQRPSAVGNVYDDVTATNTKHFQCTTYVCALRNFQVKKGRNDATNVVTNVLPVASGGRSKRFYLEIDTNVQTKRNAMLTVDRVVLPRREKTLREYPRCGGARLRFLFCAKRRRAKPTTTRRTARKSERTLYKYVSSASFARHVPKGNGIYAVRLHTRRVYTRTIHTLTLSFPV